MAKAAFPLYILLLSFISVGTLRLINAQVMAAVSMSKVWPEKLQYMGGQYVAVNKAKISEIIQFLRNMTAGS
ncbi:hypothetical protein RJ640_006412 [Escallonia rubra]|uniref:Uncharacterized protein n=1 Tax=Escallonia rubra TaxID=112253 RepID=A0AA88RKI6_9ASTE|nr:hypothetical protein RJ640_006412 [Escallonia rubra]